MDVIRSAYTDVMAIRVQGQLRNIPVTWYFAPKNAKLLGLTTCFGSSNWDASHLPEVYEYGEPRGAARTYYNGKNVWGYTGQCRIGSDHAFTFGDTNQAPAVVPACCRPPSGQIFYLKSALTPPQSVVPGTFVGSWDNFGDATTAALLDTVIGTATQSFPIVYPGTGYPPPATIAVKQYLCAPMSAATIFARLWSAGAGFGVLAINHMALTPYFGVSLIDGNTGEALAELIPPSIMRGSTVNPTPFFFNTRGELVAQVDILAGNYLCLELGVGYSVVGAGFETFSSKFLDSGPTPPDPNNPLITTPASFLDYRSD